MVAEFEVWHSRPAAPTRRVAISGGHLPVDPSPGYGGLLLAGIVASYAEHLDDDLADDFQWLLGELAAGRRVPQPVLRHRLQVDRIGLSSSTHRLVIDGERLRLDLADDAPPLPQMLAVAYRVGQMPAPIRRSLFTLISSAASWTAGPTDDILPWLTGADPDALPTMIGVDPLQWALEVMGMGADSISKRSVQRRFRTLLREAHPDHGGDEADAAEEIDRLNAARDILLSSHS